MRLARIAAVGWFVLFANGCQSLSDDRDSVSPARTYPDTARGSQVDDYFGVEVADPYRWLEVLDDSDVTEFVEAQNALAIPYLESVAARQRIISRLVSLWDVERFRLPVQRGGRTFYRRNDGLQNQDVLFVAENTSAEPRSLIDPNVWSADATTSLARFEPSPDGNLVAYSISAAGSDWKTWKVRDVATGKDLSDRIEHTKFTHVSWTRDSRGFYYSRYPQDDEGVADGGKQVEVFFHEIGRPQRADAFVYRVTDHDNRNPYAELSEDGRYLVYSIADGWDFNGVYYQDLQAAGADDPVVRLFDDWDALYHFLGNVGSRFYFHTTLAAERGRVIAVDIDRGHIQQIVAEQPQSLDSATVVGGRLVLQYLEDARSKVSVHELDGRPVGDVELPGLGSVGGFGGEISQTETFYSFSSFTTPTTLYRYDIATGRSSLFRKPEIPVDLDRFETRQVFYRSADGTRVSMFLIHARDMIYDATNPTLLYGYGGFNVPLTPSYRNDLVVWLEMGGVMAIANLRGGGEYGTAWHRAGTKLEKQNVFDDFIAAAEYLIEQNITSRDKLAIQGRSNGGLLVAAVMTQRPDLFGAALPGVGVLDMLRYHTASANARQWSSDYGLSEDEEQFHALRAYSPVHNLSSGTCYPPTLVTTADHDDRVVPWHSYKFTAELQRVQSCDNPILLRVETRAGHGAGMPTWMRIDHIADQYAFLARVFGLR